VDFFCHKDTETRRNTEWIFLTTEAQRLGGTQSGFFFNKRQIGYKVLFKENYSARQKDTPKKSEDITRLNIIRKQECFFSYKKSLIGAEV